MKSQTLWRKPGRAFSAWYLPCCFLLSAVCLPVKASDKSSDEILAALSPFHVSHQLDGIHHSIDLQLLFRLNSAELMPETSNQLQALAQAFLQGGLTQCAFYLIGHTDSTGSVAINQPLSYQRAGSVRDWLLQQPGLKKMQFRVLGVADQQLLPNYSASDARQRRVEVKLANANECVVNRQPVRESDGELRID